VLLQSALSPAVWVYPNMGVGKVGWNGLDTPIIIPVAAGGRSITQGDIDGDGDVDFIVAHRFLGSLTFIINLGNNEFVTTTVASELDLAVAIREQHRLDIWTNQGGDILTASPFSHSFSIDSGGQEPKFVGYGDIDLDGDIDFIVPNSKPTSQGPLTVIKNNTPQGVGCTGDVNCDGRIDVTDLLWVISFWGTNDMVADLNADGTVEIGDVLLLVAQWGVCP